MFVRPPHSLSGGQKKRRCLCLLTVYLALQGGGGLASPLLPWAVLEEMSPASLSAPVGHPWVMAMVGMDRWDFYVSGSHVPASLTQPHQNTQHQQQAGRWSVSLQA
ncbi:hypothetical protein QOT17_017472 [Balamuthia mandrillaris]